MIGNNEVEYLLKLGKPIIQLIGFIPTTHLYHDKKTDAARKGDLDISRVKTWSGSISLCYDLPVDRCTSQCHRSKVGYNVKATFG